MEFWLPEVVRQEPLTKWIPGRYLSANVYQTHTLLQFPACDCRCRSLRGKGRGSGASLDNSSLLFGAGRAHCDHRGRWEAGLAISWRLARWVHTTEWQCADRVERH